MPILLNYFLAGILGILLNVFLVKIPRLKILGKAANHPFTLKEYLNDDWVVLVGNLLTVLAIIFGWKEIIGIKPVLENYAILVFISVGFIGSSIALAAFSIATKKLTSVIDIKANLADGINPVVNSDNVKGVKEIVKEIDTKNT